METSFVTDLFVGYNHDGYIGIIGEGVLIKELYALIQREDA